MNKTIGGGLRTLCLLGLALLSTSALASISVTLSPSPAGPQPVGTVITWTATVSDTAPGTHEYRFTVGPAAGPFQIVRDFNLSNTFPWAFSQTDGTYKVRVVVQNTSNQTSNFAAVNFVVTSRRPNGLDAVPGAVPLCLPLGQGQVRRGEIAPGLGQPFTTLGDVHSSVIPIGG